MAQGGIPSAVPIQNLSANILKHAGLINRKYTMTKKDRLMTALRGNKPDQIPFTIYKWILENVDSADAERLLGKGLIPIDSVKIFKEIPDDTINIQIVENGAGKDKRFSTTIETPLGSIHEEYKYEEMFGSKWIDEHFIKNADDMSIMKYVFDHTIIEENFEEYKKALKEMGDNGIVLGEIIPVPITWLWVNYMGVEVWSEALYFHTEIFNSLHESLLNLYRQQIELAAVSPAEVIWFGDNVTGTVISPKIYKTYCVPVYNEVSKPLKKNGKLSLAHYDGENLVLKDLIAGAKLDIMEAFTPPPMERMTVKEAREAWPDKVLSLNFPGNVYTEKDSVIRNYTSTYIKEAGDPSGFIIGCTEEFDFSTFGRAFDVIADVINGMAK